MPLPEEDEIVMLEDFDPIELKLLIDDEGEAISYFIAYF